MEASLKLLDNVSSTMSLLQHLFDSICSKWNLVLTVMGFIETFRRWMTWMIGQPRIWTTNRYSTRWMLCHLSYRDWHHMLDSICLTSSVRNNQFDGVCYTMSVQQVYLIKSAWKMYVVKTAKHFVLFTTKEKKYEKDHSTTCWPSQLNKFSLANL